MSISRMLTVLLALMSAVPAIAQPTGNETLEKLKTNCGIAVDNLATAVGNNLVLNQNIQTLEERKANLLKQLGIYESLRQAEGEPGISLNVRNPDDSVVSAGSAVVEIQKSLADADMQLAERRAELVDIEALKSASRDRCFWWGLQSGKTGEL